MLGFIKKDLYMMKGNLKILAILFIIYIGFSLDGKMDISFLIPLMSVMLIMSTFSYDTYNKWDAYSCTIPNGRKNGVKAKYLTTLILIVVSALIISFFSVIFMNFQSNLDLEKIKTFIIESIIGSLFLEAIMFPSIYKFGIEKARIGIFMIIFGGTIFLTILSKIWNLRPIISTLETLDSLGIMLLLLFILLISFHISIHIVSKKEF